MQICVKVGALAADTSYQLVLPAGTKYGPQSSLSKDLSFNFTSTLPFRIPFPRTEFNFRAPSLSETQYVGVGSTWLELYLPHGLSDDTTAEQLQGRLKLEEIAAPWGGPTSPQPVDFSVNISQPYDPNHQVAEHVLESS
jgi:hypothetical protein